MTSGSFKIEDFKSLIEKALQQQYSWKALGNLLEEIAPTLVEYKQYVEVLLIELETFHQQNFEKNKTNNDKIVTFEMSSGEDQIVVLEDLKVNYSKQEQKTFETAEKETNQMHASNQNTKVKVKNYFKCDVCHKSFKAKQSLQNHHRTHTGEKPFECSVCKHSFSLLGNLNRHQMLHSGNLENHLKGEVSETPTNIRKDLELAQQTLDETIAHNEHPLFETLNHVNDLQEFKNEYYMKGKNSNEEGKLKFECNVCLKSFKAKAILQSHTKTHTGEKAFECKTCGTRFTTKQALKTHAYLHTGEKPYHCNFCTKKFSDPAALKRHEMLHTGEKSFKCELCEESFVRSSGLTNHKTTHTGEKPYQCNFCMKTFSHFSNMSRHQKTSHSFKLDEPKHTIEKSFQCKTCTKRFSQLENLKRHEILHTDKKINFDFECDICHKSFMFKSALLRHQQQIHEGEKPFVCKICTKQFYLPQHLEVHERRHTGEKPFECSKCKKTFVQLSDLTRHQRTHTGEKLYQCKLCEKSFSQSCGLKKHQKKIHSD